MARLSVARQKTCISEGIIPGVIIGGFVGILIGFLFRTNILIIPGLSTVFSIIPFNEIIGGTLIGIVIGGLIGGFLALYSTDNINNAEYAPATSTPKQSLNYSENVTLQIKEEQLDLAKKWMQTAEVKIYRESFTQEKKFTVPVKREELVIEKKVLASTTPERKDVPTEVIRILLSEEKVEFKKHRVALEDVSIYKQQIEDIKHIEETLMREESKVKISGSPKVRDESNSKQS